MTELREKLADLCHSQWSGWMRYLFSKCIPDKPRGWDTGNVIIPAEFVKRWQRQMQTDYKYLSEEENNSDRAEADKFLQLLEENSGQTSDTNTAIIDKLQSALDMCMIGGNHIASNLLRADIDPIDYENYDDARNSIATKYDHKSDKWLPLYEDWCCWRTIMDARKIARDALKEYTGEVKECFKD